MKQFFILTFVIGIALLACQLSGGQQTDPTPSPTMPGSDLERLTRLAIRDLSQRLGLDPGLIQVVSAQAVTWPDASLGCPRAGMAYAQVLIPGYRILLKANGQLHEYHAGRDAHVFYCENPTSPVPDAPEDI